MSEIRTVTATFITKPARRLIIRRGILSIDYFSYCEEIGCDIWAVLEKVPDRLDAVSFVVLPEFLVAPGTSKVGCAAEVPVDWRRPLPDGCDLIELAEHAMLWFQGAPYEDESWYGGAHAEMAAAVRGYRPELYGYRFAYDSAPEFHYGASPENGCRQLVPVAALNGRPPVRPV